MMQNIQDHFQIIVLHAFLFNLMPFVSCLSLLRSWTNLYHWHLIFCFPVSLNFQAAHLCRPTWIALGHSIDVGGAEHANTCPSPILHAHAQAQAHGRHSAHQEHHTENDARDGSAPGTHRHTHTHCEPPGQVWWVAADRVSFHTDRVQHVMQLSQEMSGCVTECVQCVLWCVHVFLRAVTSRLRVVYL